MFQLWGLYLAERRPGEAEELVGRLGPEYLAWFRYILGRKRK